MGGALLANGIVFSGIHGEVCPAHALLTAEADEQGVVAEDGGHVWHWVLNDPPRVGCLVNNARGECVRVRLQHGRGGRPGQPLALHRRERAECTLCGAWHWPGFPKAFGLLQFRRVMTTILLLLRLLFPLQNHQQKRAFQQHRIGSAMAKFIGERDVAETCGSHATGQNERQSQRIAQAESRVVLNISLDGLKLRVEIRGLCSTIFRSPKFRSLFRGGCGRLWLHFRHGGRQTQILRGENGTDGGPRGALHSFGLMLLNSHQIVR